MCDTNIINKTKSPYRSDAFFMLIFFIACESHFFLGVFMTNYSTVATRDVLLSTKTEFDKNRIRIVVSPLTKEEARILFPYRPFSAYSESLCGGGNTMCDDVCRLLNGMSKRCRMCQAPTMDTDKGSCLTNGICPDCNGQCQKTTGLDPFLPKEEWLRQKRALG